MKVLLVGFVFALLAVSNISLASDLENIVAAENGAVESKVRAKKSTDVRRISLFKWFK